MNDSSQVKLYHGCEIDVPLCTAYGFRTLSVFGETGAGKRMFLTAFRNGGGEGRLLNR